MPFFESLQLLLIPGAHPIIDTGALDAQEAGALRRSMPLDTHADGLHAQDDTGRPVGFGLWLQVEEVVAGALIAASANRLPHYYGSVALLSGC